MIWDYIRDFIVQYIFGGYTSDSVYYSGFIGGISVNGEFDNAGEANFLAYPVAYYDNGLGNYDPVYLGLGDWLSTTATIIIMALAVVLACLLVRWIWRAVSSAMLLR